MFHQKTDGIATFSTTKTFKNLLGGGNCKRWGFLVMKRAEAKIIGAPSFEFYKTPNDFKYINPRLDLLYRILCNQAFKYKPVTLL